MLAALSLQAASLWLTSVIWFLAAAVCVLERLGPFQSMERSRMLTKGGRWLILGIALVLIVVRSKANAAFTGGDDIVRVVWVIGDSLLIGFYLAVVLAYYYLRTSPRRPRNSAAATRIVQKARGFPWFARGRQRAIYGYNAKKSITACATIGGHSRPVCAYQ